MLLRQIINRVLDVVHTASFLSIENHYGSWIRCTAYGFRIDSEFRNKLVPKYYIFTAQYVNTRRFDFYLIIRIWLAVIVVDTYFGYCNDSRTCRKFSRPSSNFSTLFIITMLMGLFFLLLLLITTTTVEVTTMMRKHYPVASRGHETTWNSEYTGKNVNLLVSLAGSYRSTRLCYT